MDRREFLGMIGAVAVGSRLMPTGEEFSPEFGAKVHDACEQLCRDWEAHHTALIRSILIEPFPFVRE